MKLDDLKQAWQQEVKVLDTKPEISQAIDAIEGETKKLDREIKFRDILESIIALALIPVFCYRMFHVHSLTEMAGTIVLTLSCLYIPYKLYKARKHHGSRLTSVKAFLELERDKVKAQMTLLGSVLTWYLLPLLTGIILVSLGVRVDELGHFVFDKVLIGYLSFVFVFFLLIWYVNVRTVRKKFQPILTKIEQRLAELDQ